MSRIGLSTYAFFWRMSPQVPQPLTLAQMLQQMSGSVQFLSVSHNKATMEAAEQLCGVTMREPGVSRLVSVDLQQAAQLAGAA